MNRLAQGLGLDSRGYRGDLMVPTLGKTVFSSPQRRRANLVRDRLVSLTTRPGYIEDVIDANLPLTETRLRRAENASSSVIDGTQSSLASVQP
jgi:hypothetical protein